MSETYTVLFLASAIACLLPCFSSPAPPWALWFLCLSAEPSVLCSGRLPAPVIELLSAACCTVEFSLLAPAAATSFAAAVVLSCGGSWKGGGCWCALDRGESAHYQELAAATQDNRRQINRQTDRRELCQRGAVSGADIVPANSAGLIWRFTCGDTT